jgi:cyanuric acid amidohydrolase
MIVEAYPLLTRRPDDTEALAALLSSGQLRAEEVVCVLGKTEGNGGRNDFTRDLAMHALETLFAPYLGLPPSKVQDRVIFSFSGGTEGVVAPHMIVFARRGALAQTPAPEKRLVIGTAWTRPFAPHEIGRTAQLEATAEAITQLLGELQLAPEDVHLVQMKGAIPPYSYQDAEAAESRGEPLRCDMVYSRGASALGVALALGEVSRDSLRDAVVCRDFSLYSGRASVSAKPGLVRSEILLFGNSDRARGSLQIGHAVLRDILDAASLRALLRRLGLRAEEPPLPEEVARLVGVFAKSEADPRGSIRGARHTMLQDDDISDTRYSRCVLASVLASVTGTTQIYVSTRAEHHGPLGGGPVAVIVRQDETPSGTP